MFEVFLIGHIAAGVITVLAGAAAILTPKTPGRHPRRGTVYLAAFTALVAAAAGLGILAWPRDTHLLVLAGIALALGALAYTARKVRRADWLRWHITGMGGSYILILTAFYVDNGPNLPLWNLLPRSSSGSSPPPSAPRCCSAPCTGTPGAPGGRVGRHRRMLRHRADAFPLPRRRRDQGVSCESWRSQRMIAAMISSER